MPSNPINHRRFNGIGRRYKQTIRAEFYEENLEALDRLIQTTGLTVSEILRQSVLLITHEQLIRAEPTVNNEFRCEPWTCACDKTQHHEACLVCGLNYLDLSNPEFDMIWYKANMEKLKSEGKWNLA